LMPMRWSLRRTLAICSHASADTGMTQTERQLQSGHAQGRSLCTHHTLCGCTHSRLLSSSSLSSVSLAAPRVRCVALSEATLLCVSSRPALHAVSGSAPRGARGWRGGWVHARVAAPPCCSVREVCLLPPCAAVMLLSRPTAGASFRSCVVLQRRHGEQRVQ